jgi:hypothetical protein
MICLGVESSRAQTPNKEPMDVLRAAINGSSYEMKNGDRVERYSYDAVNVAQCSLSWTETHEAKQPDQPTLREWSEIRLPLNLLDVSALKVEPLKSSGFLVPLLIRGLKPVIASHQRTQWGDDPAYESFGTGATGTAFYFRDREAQRVFMTIASLAKPCRTE